MRSKVIAASLFALVVSACTGALDAEGDGPGDDDPDAPASTDVRVIVKDGGAPQSGVRVIFQGAGDVLVSDVTTDAAGIATATLVTGSVTVMRVYPQISPPPEGGQPLPEVFTYVGVKAGDLIELGNAQPITAPTPSAIVVTVPGTAQGNVTVKTPCGSGSGEAPNIAITVSNCPAMMDFYVTNDGTGFYAKAAYAPNVNLSTGSFADSLASTLSATNVPANTSVEIDQRLYAGDFMLFSSGNKRVDQTAQTVDLPTLDGVDQLLVARVNTNGMGNQLVASRSSFNQSPVIYDAAANLIPYVSNVDYDALTGITWMETGTGTADAVYVAMKIQRQGGGIGSEYMRYVIAPHAGLTTGIPFVPDPSFNPGMNDNIGGSMGLVKATGGYDSIRKRAFATDSVVEGAAAGSAVTLSYSGNEPRR